MDGLPSESPCRYTRDCRLKADDDWQKVGGNALEGHRSASDEHPGWASAELRYCVAKKFIKID